MQLQNEFTVPAPVDDVWKTLLDVQRVAPCMPGATLDRVEGDEVAGRVRVKVGPVALSYAGTARFATKDEAGHRLVIEARGRETRGSGTASATVETRMSEEASATRVTVVTDLDVSGKPAQFGRGVMAEVAGKLTDQFAACLAERVRDPSAGAPASSGRTSAEAPARAAAAADELAAAPHPAAAAPEALNLVSTVAGPLARQLAPVAGGAVAGFILGLLLGHRRQVSIVIAPTPRRAVPRGRAIL